MTWKHLLDEPDGPEGRYAQMLRPLCKRADPPEHAGRVLVRSDEPLAAIAVLQGARAARPFATAAVSAIDRLGQRLAVSPAGVNPLSQLMLLSVSCIADAVGVTMPVPPFDLEERLTELLVARSLEAADRVTLVLIAMGHGRRVDLRSLTSSRKTKVSGEPVALLEALATASSSAVTTTELADTWERFILDFPAALAAEAVEWRHLLLAARIALPKLGIVKFGDTAQALHQRVVGLAATPEP